MKKSLYIRLVESGFLSDHSYGTGRNPRTGEEIQIKASRNPAFKAGKALKEAVN